MCLCVGGELNIIDHWNQFVKKKNLRYCTVLYCTVLYCTVCTDQTIKFYFIYDVTQTNPYRNDVYGSESEGGAEHEINVVFPNLLNSDQVSHRGRISEDSATSSFFTLFPCVFTFTSLETKWPLNPLLLITTHTAGLQGSDQSAIWNWRKISFRSGTVAYKLKKTTLLRNFYFPIIMLFNLKYFYWY